MSDTSSTSRVEPTIDTPNTASGSDALRAVVETSNVPAPPAAPQPVAVPVAASASRPARDDVDQLSRIEEKTARIEEKYARSEAMLQRVVDKVDGATGRMQEVARHADMAAVRAEVADIGRRTRRLPGLTALVMVALVSALLTAALTLVAIRYLPGLLPR